MGKVKITASIEMSPKEDGTEIINTLKKNFSNKEISNIHSFGEFICFDIVLITCVDLLHSFFSNLQLYVNGNSVNMAMLK